MLGYSYMVRSLRIIKNNNTDYSETDEDITAETTDITQHYSDFWIVWGKLKRITKKQLWRDRLTRLKLNDLQRVATLGVGGFGR